MDIIWDGSRLLVAGPDTGPVPLGASSSITLVGIRVRPGRGGGVLGIPVSDVRDQRPDLAEVWRAGAAEPLAAHVGEASSPRTVEALLEDAVRRRLAAAPRADRLVGDLVDLLRARPRVGPGVVAGLAEELGVCERTLHRRCSAAVGYGPKTLDRVLRFGRALHLAESRTAAQLAALAAMAGYADQAHLARECRRMSGLTPSELFKTVR